MPELPEVQSTLNGLLDFVPNQKINKIVINFPTLRYPIPENIQVDWTDKYIFKIKRNAKYLFFFSNKRYLVFHLGMSGTLRLQKILAPKKKHDHIEFILSNGLSLIYNDPRRFGFLLDGPIESYKLKYLNKFGIDALSSSLNLNSLTKILTKKTKIKELLMNQKFIGGIGNIYASEILYAARIHPHSISSNLTTKSISRLLYSIKSVLNKAVKLGGSSISNYYGVTNETGHFQINFMVYSRADKKCKGCNHKISKEIIAQRSTFFCNKCQIYY
jgi:formamidopyrimidine-DNA glycosylase